MPRVLVKGKHVGIQVSDAIRVIHREWDPSRCPDHRLPSFKAGKSSCQLAHGFKRRLDRIALLNRSERALDFRLYVLQLRALTHHSRKSGQVVCNLITRRGVLESELTFRAAHRVGEDLWVSGEIMDNVQP